MAKLWKFSQGHPKPAFSIKRANGGPREIFQKSPKKLPSLKKPKKSLKQMALSSNKYALIAPRLEKILAQNPAPKVPEWQSYGTFCKVTLNQHFSEKVERRDQLKFCKNRPKSSPWLKGPKALWRKLNYTLIKMHLTYKDWRIFWRK